MTQQKRIHKDLGIRVFPKTLHCNALDQIHSDGVSTELQSFNTSLHLIQIEVNLQTLTNFKSKLVGGTSKQALYQMRVLLKHRRHLQTLDPAGSCGFIIQTTIP